MVRSENLDPLRQTTLIANTPHPVSVENRRVGRPRKNWAWMSFQNLYIKNNMGTNYTLWNDKLGSLRNLDVKIRDRALKA